MKTLQFGSRGFWGRLQRFAEDPAAATGSVRETVGEILAAVRERGDAAVLEYTQKLDGFRCGAAELRIGEAELGAATRALRPAQRRHIREAIRSVKEFHQRGKPKDWTARNPQGALVGERWYPIRRVGIYIPAGQVPLVSTAVMTTTLARLAGVESMAVFTPAGADGRVSEQMLAGLSLCGVQEVYRIGGAQAVGAMAYGTQTIERTEKVMGPGNAYVAEAQRQVFGEVGVDLLPGPSEAMAIADETARADWLAADLLAQAEHGSGRERVYYLFQDREQAKAVRREVGRILPRLKHREAVERIWKERTLGILVPDLAGAAEVANFVAPEHLELHVEKAAAKWLTGAIRTAGAILRGHETATVLGDFTAGPSHTLPTARTGRFFSGLKITDFMRRSSVVEYDRKSLERAREVVRTFAELEDLDAHGYSMEIRFEEREDS